jgi:hypothetical protein
MLPMMNTNCCQPYPQTTGYRQSPYVSPQVTETLTLTEIIQANHHTLTADELNCGCIRRLFSGKKNDAMVTKHKSL